MTAQLGHEDPRLQRMEQATLWLQRMRAPGSDERVMEDWLDWCQRDPLNQQAFDDIAAIWELSGQLDAEPAATAAAAPPSTAIRPQRRALMASLAALGIATITGGWWWAQSRSPDVVTTEHVSPVGRNVTQTLADGSVLELGAGTRVAVEMAAHSRRVILHEGELFVTVQHDSSRPFSVDAGRLEVVATGTAFNVRRTTGRITVTVAEGTVETMEEGRGDSRNTRLEAGQKLVFAHDAQYTRQVKPELAAAWREGMLTFDDEPMSEVITTLNRYFTRKLVIEASWIRSLPMTASVRADGSDFDVWLRGLGFYSVQPAALADGRLLLAPLPVAEKPD